MSFWVPHISCHSLTSLYINYMTNGFVPVVRKRILYIMLLVRTPSLRESTLVKSLVYFSSLHPRFTSLFQLIPLYIFQAHILASQVHFIRVSCLFFDPTSSLLESITVESNQTGPNQRQIRIYPLENSCWSNNKHIIVQ